jgi:hypothetical protein
MTAGITNDGAQEWVKFELEFDVPSGTAIKQVFLDCSINWDPSGGGMIFIMIGTQFWPVGLTDEGTKWIHKEHFKLLDDTPASTTPFLAGRTGHQKVYCLVNDGERIIVQLTVELETLTSVKDKWQAHTWNALYNAAQVKYYAEQQDIAARITAIEDNLANVDTLTLRREESDEIMKNTLKFVLGPLFDFMPAAVQKAFEAEGNRSRPWHLLRRSVTG